MPAISEVHQDELMTETARREYKYQAARDRACRMLGFYLCRNIGGARLASKAEVETIVDSIIEAARNCDL